MAIPVICPGCKRSFRVGDQFAGKTGPCPKCKTLINIPKPGAGGEELVKIHGPDAAEPKDAKGRVISKPIPMVEFTVGQNMAWVAAGSTLVVFLAAWLLGSKLRDPDSLVLRAIGLMIVTPPLAAAGYYLLRDRDKLELFFGRQLWFRTAICTAVYLTLWAAFGFVRANFDIPVEVWQLFIVAPPMLFLGSLAALACFEFDFSTAFLHYIFHLLVVLALCYVAGMHDLWPRIM